MLDHLLIEVTRVPEQAASNVVGVLQPVEKLINERRLRSLSELCLAVLGCAVEVVDPIVVRGSEVLRDVVLEHDHVAVWDLLRILGRDERCEIVLRRVYQDR